MSSLNSNNFITKSNKTKLYALFGTCNGYNSLYGKCLKALSSNIYIFVDVPLLTFLCVKNNSVG